MEVTNSGYNLNSDVLPNLCSPLPNCIIFNNPFYSNYEATTLVSLCSTISDMVIYILYYVAVLFLLVRLYSKLFTPLYLKLKMGVL